MYMYVCMYTIYIHLDSTTALASETSLEIIL